MIIFITGSLYAKMTWCQKSLWAGMVSPDYISHADAREMDTMWKTPGIEVIQLLAGILAQAGLVYSLSEKMPRWDKMPDPSPTFTVISVTKMAVKM